MTSRFRVLDGRIDLEVDVVDDIVMACVVLHNYLKANDANDYAQPTYMPSDFVDYENANGDVIEGAWRREIQDHHNYAKPADDIDENPTRLAYGIRERFKNHFVSDTGKLKWQDKFVNEGNY